MIHESMIHCTTIYRSPMRAKLLFLLSHYQDFLYYLAKFAKVCLSGVQQLVIHLNQGWQTVSE